MTEVFAVYDEKAEAYLNPLFFPNAATALRAFTGAACSEGHDFNTFAADYTLFHIGTYDNSTGRLVQADAFVNLGTALSVRAAATNSDVTPIAGV